MQRAAVLIVVLGTLTACVDSSRVNARCVWVEASSQRLDLSQAADRDHLRGDAQVAGELGVRASDVHFRSNPDLGDPIQQACTARLLDTIASRHQVARVSVVAAAYARVWWGDLLVVYLPLAVVVALAIDAIVRRIRRSFDSEDRLLAGACTAVFVAIVPVLGLGVGQLWAFTMEGVFLRNEHVAFRGTFVPILRHGWIAVFSLLALCILVALRRVARSPLQRIERSYASYLGAPVQSSTRTTGRSAAHR